MKCCLSSIFVVFYFFHVNAFSEVIYFFDHQIGDFENRSICFYYLLVRNTEVPLMYNRNLVNNRIRKFEFEIHYLDVN